MRPMVNLLSFGGRLSLYPIDEHVRCARERYEQAEEIRNTRRKCLASAVDRDARTRGKQW